MRREKTLWFVTEAYYPDEVGTAYYMTKLAEGLAASFNARALCGFPIYNARGAKVPNEEIHGKVRIKRCRGTTFDKDRFFLRIVNLATISLSLFFHALARFRKNDVVLVVTSPPLLPFTIKTACALKRAKCILRIDDVYPEALIAAGMLNPRSPSAAFMRSLNKWLYRRVEAIIVLGQDMERLARQKAAPAVKNISIIPNWADVDDIFPVPKSQNALLKELGLSEKFVALCAGNMGRAQAIETMFGAAERMKGIEGIHFLFIGSGAKRSWMDREAKEKPLENVTILDHRPRSDQNNFLNACDISLVSLAPGMTGAGVPSRLYNIMAAGKPIIAVAPGESELCRVVREEDIGWIVPPDRPDLLAETIRTAAAAPQRLADMGARARSAALGKYSPVAIVKKYRELAESFHV